MSETRNGIHFRLRGTWEAADLGLLLLRKHASHLALFFGLPFTAAVFASAFLSEAFSEPFWGILLLWWLKPLWDRLIVLPSSVLAFRPQATWKEVARSFTALFNASFWAEISIFRFSATRSALLPAQLLEGLRGKDLKTRKSNLRKTIGPSGASLTFTFLTIEVGLYFSFFPLLKSLAPSLADPLLFQALGDGSYFVPVVFYALCIALVEPLYALGGFGLYLNRRTLVEGWDIELTFRSMKRRRIGPGALAFVLFFLAAPAFLPSQERAEESWKQSAQSVLSDPEFGGEKKELGLVAKPNEQKTEAASVPVPESQTTQVSWGVLVVVCVVLAVALAAIVFAVFRKRSIRRPKPLTGPSSEVAQEFQETPPKVETDWRVVVTDLVGKGEFREALSLLYRTGLRLVGTNEKFPRWATEEDCLALAVKHLESNGPKKEALERLLALWTTVAWAQKSVDRTEIIDLRDVLSTWENPN